MRRALAISGSRAGKAPLEMAVSVSVLVTTYNHAPFVREALDSLLTQTTKDFELIIIDDASRDGSAGIIDRKSTRLNSSHIQKSRMPSSA